MNTPAIPCKSRDEVHAAGVGGFFIDRSKPNRPRLFVWIPKDTIPADLALFDNGTDHHWTLSGTDEAPSLTPSIHAPDVWHGYLTNGVFTEC